MSADHPTPSPADDENQAGGATWSSGAGTPLVPARRDGRRTALQWPTVLVIIIIWNLLWGNFSVANVLSGLAIAALIVVTFPLPPILFTGRIRPVGLAQLLLRFALDLVVASVQVAWLAVRPGPAPGGAVIQVDLYSDSDLYATLTAELVTLVPGSVVIDVRRATSTLFVHTLDVETDDDIAAARRSVLREERRVMNALASDEEMRAYHQAIAERETL